MNKRRSHFVVIAIVAVIMASGIIFGTFSYQPLQHVDWKQKINGQIGEVITDNSSIYVANYSIDNTNINPFIGNYSYSVYKLNSTSGRISWVSAPMYFRGLQSQFFNDGGPLGLKIWIQNQSLFAMGGDASNFQFTQYKLYSINITSGITSGSQTISFPYMRGGNNSAFYPVILTQGPDMYLSQVHTIFHPATLLSYSTTTFVSYRYELHNDTYRLAGNLSVSIPTLNSYSWGSEHSILEGDIQVTYIQGTGKIIVDNYHNQFSNTVNMTPEAMSGSQSSIFVATITNSTLGVYEFNNYYMNGSLVFNYSNPIFGVNPSFSPITMSVLPNGFFLVNYYQQGEYYYNGTPIQSNCQLIAFDTGGDVVWSYNYSSFPYFAQYGIETGNDLFVSIHTIDSGSYIYPQARFAVINYTDGKVLWSHTYYSSTTRNDGSAFMEPANYKGLLYVANNKVLFKIGNSIEFANVPR